MVIRQFHIACMLKDHWCSQAFSVANNRGRSMYESKNVYPLSARSEKLSSCSFCASSVSNLFGAIYRTRGFPEHTFRINLIEANIVCIIPVKIVKTFPLPPSPFPLTRVGDRKTGPPEIKLIKHFFCVFIVSILIRISKVFLDVIAFS